MTRKSVANKKRRPTTVTSSGGLDAAGVQLVADLLALYSRPLPTGDWEGASDKNKLILARLEKLGWSAGRGPKPSAEIEQFFATHEGI